MSGIFLVLGMGGGPAWGEEVTREGGSPDLAAEKRQYTLFNPTPRDLMREMSTDRPDVTESAYTVDAGHVQLEMSFVEFGRDDGEGGRTDVWDVAPMNWKLGLLNDMDIQFVFSPYQRVETETDGQSDVAEGFGDDTELRLKVNLWGNDSGATALALMPFVKFPTGSDELTNDHVEGGLIIPLSITLPGGWYTGGIAEADFVFNEETGGYGVDFVHTAVLGHDIPLIENLGGYMEYVGVAPYDTGITYQAVLSGGLTYTIGGDVQFDCGARVGLSDSADDLVVFTGVSVRH